jgi:glycosyltransferase involved in cell wall biosynthesis
MNSPWLSVIMPCRNGERWLAAALQSVVDQNEPGLEVIFIDSSDGDNSAKIAESFSNRLALRIYRRPDLASWTAKTNFAAAEARADWISMLHVDDLWLPGRCAALGRWLERASGAVMHLHPAYFIDETGARVGTWRCPLPNGGAAVPAALLRERLLVQNFIPIPGPTIRRNAFLAVGGVDDALWYTADWDLYFKVCLTGDVWYHPVPLACFRIHKHSLTIAGSRSVDDFRSQLEVVRDRYAPAVTAQSNSAILDLAAAAIDVNTALAATNAGNTGEWTKALRSLLRLGPLGIGRYVYYSRIVDRLVPRLRARLAGGL